MLKLVVIISIIFLIPLAEATEELCSKVIVNGEIDLSETEKRMICGDPEKNAYKKIPSYEASYFFKGFLQTRGYLDPKFETKNGVLIVEPGKKFYVKKIVIKNGESLERAKIGSELRRLYQGKLLSTSTLNSLEGEANGLLMELGHPCSKVKSEVDISRSLVVVHLEQLHKFNFGPVAKEEIEGLRENALERFYPFEADMTFNQKLLTLTEKRMVRSEVVSGTYFMKTCDLPLERFSLAQNFIVGPPRTIRFGVGASTEVGPMARVRWSNNRYKSMASLLSANLQASLRNQALNLSADSFFWKNSPRRSLLSQFEIIRDSQLDYEQLVTRLKPHMKWTRDAEGFHKVYTLGPTYEAGTYHSRENSDTKSFATGLLEGGAQWMSHDYEFFDIHPEDGNLFSLNFDFRHPSLGFTDPLIKLDTSAVQLTRLGSWGRGTIVGGLRLNAGTTWVDNDASLSGLPPVVKFFGGGSDDVRGFSLRTLPQNDGLGALTKVGAKFELRRTYLFHQTVEGFTFFDTAYFGERSWRLDPPLYYSPGVGLRWLSPIGLVQGYASRGYRTHAFKSLGNFFYLGIGGVF